jgi:predicted membrane protein
MMLVIGVPLALRQYLFRHYYDTMITLIVFLGIFITVQFNIPGKFLLPILFFIGAIYIFFRDFIESKEMSESEQEEDLNEEIEEDLSEKKKK